MARNGSGVFSLASPGNPVVTGTTISSTWANSTLSDIATALTQSIASTGVTTPSANLPMGGYRHTGVGNATAQANYASVTDVQNGSLVTLSAVAGVDTITATAPFTVAAYAAGQAFQFVSAGANTGAVTLNVSLLGAKAVTRLGATALVAGDIPSGSLIKVVYDGTQFQAVGGLATFTYKGTAAGTVDLLTGSNIASAATINLDTATGNRVHVTGNTTITAVTLTRGPRTVIFDGVLTLTYHATNNNLPGGVNITTAAGDVAFYESDGTTVRCVAYTRATGNPINPNVTSMVLLATLTPTAAANVDFLTTFASIYDNYRVFIEGVKPATDDFLLMRLAVAGVADSGSNYSGGTSASMAFNGSVNNNTLAAGKGCCMVIDIINANDATNAKAITDLGATQIDAVPTYGKLINQVLYTAANAVSGLRLYWSGGANFAAVGKVRVYAYNNS